MLAKRKVSGDPLPAYLRVSDVRREPGEEITNEVDVGHLISLPTYLGRKRDRSPGGTAARAQAGSIDLVMESASMELWFVCLVLNSPMACF